MQVAQAIPNYPQLVKGPYKSAYFEIDVDYAKTDMIRPLFRANPSKIGQILSRSGMKFIQIRQSMVDGRLPVGIGQRQTLGVRDRNKLHIGVFAEDRDELGQVQSPVQRRQYRRGATPAHRKT